MAGNPEPLFSDGDLQPAMEAARRGVVEEVDRYDADQLLAQAEDDVVAYIADKLRSEAPVLRPDDKYVDSAGEARVDVSGRFGYSVVDRNRPAYAAGSRVEVVLPFDGDARFFRLKPSTKGLVANLGIPVRLRDDPGTFAMPVRRRRVEVSAPPPVSVPFAPEPAFVEEDFEAALQYIRGFRNTLERSPSVAAKLGEEEIRDLLLAALNGHFEGDAGGELFNGKGKTDILIRRGDRNVFIGECKFWKGAKAFGDAIDQLLGYVVWRDAKAAVLLFIRQANVTDIVAKAAETLATHPRCKRDLGGNEERHDYVFQAVGDPTREIHLVLLPFALPSTDK